MSVTFVYINILYLGASNGCSDNEAVLQGVIDDPCLNYLII
jgi:hypothetical protein